MNGKINVNEDFQQKFSKLKRKGSTSSLGDILKTRQLPVPKQTSKSDEVLKRDFVAKKLTQELGDQKSLGCYRAIADEVPQHVVFQTLGSVKEAVAAGKIRKNKGALFVEIIKQYAEVHGIELGFQALNTSPSCSPPANGL